MTDPLYQASDSVLILTWTSLAFLPSIRLRRLSPMQHAPSNSLPAQAKAQLAKVLNSPTFVGIGDASFLPTSPYCYAPPCHADSDLDILYSTYAFELYYCALLPTSFFLFLAFFFFCDVARDSETSLALEPREKLTVLVFVLNDNPRQF